MYFGPSIAALTWIMSRIGTEMRARLMAARIAPSTKTYNPDELTGLPEPVQKYFRTALTSGQPIVTAVEITQTGTFNMSTSGDKWKPFTATQLVIPRRPGFAWEARIAMLPGVPVRVHDAYVAGEGILRATLFGLFSPANQRGTPEMARGELMRFLAEAAWYPTALLPSQGVQWTAKDAASAVATLRDGETEVALLFRFSENGLIGSVHADARGRTVGKTIISTPWEGGWSDYEIHGGMCIPVQGEVAWLLPEGPKPYWRGRISTLRYNFEPHL